MRPSALDLWTLAYAAFAAGVLLWRWPERLGHPFLLLAGYLVLVLAALLAGRVRRRGGAGEFLGEFYPLVLTVLLYTGIGLVNRAAGTSHDARVQRWEGALFGFQPALDWIRAWPWPWLSWLLHLGYLSYYFILAGAPLGLWASGRRGATRRALLSMMVTFYLCYAVFLTFPVAGPRYLFPLPRNAAGAVAPALLAQRLLDQGAAWGTAFPSSHVAVSLVAAVSAWREWRALGAVLLPAAVLLTLGTVYGQFHYAMDALAGVALALAVLAAAGRIGGGGSAAERR